LIVRKPAVFNSENTRLPHGLKWGITAPVWVTKYQAIHNLQAEHSNQGRLGCNRSRQNITLRIHAL